MNIFCVGIGGIGMSAVAQILVEKGENVSGSDASDSEITFLLKEKGITVHIGHDEKNINDSVDMIIYSEAIPENNPEREIAKGLGLRQMSYAQALGMISTGKKTIAVAGTHGKTTVTGMLTSILLQGTLDPTIVIGSKIDLLNASNFRVGKGDWFLAEACEYRNNFLHLSPSILVINNLEPDHLDYFVTADKYYESFQKLAEKVSENGKIIVYENDLEKLDQGRIAAKLIILSEPLGKTFHLKIPGDHNQHNALTAFTVAKEMGRDEKEIQKGLESFNGTWRRFEYKGEINGAKIYDDYGHHPTEIKATLQGARELFPDKHIVTVFQPHQFSRTREFFNEFCSSFHDADEVWITDIYRARDSKEDVESVSAQKLVDGIEGTSRNKYISLADISDEIKNEGDSQKVFLIMGAGSIHEVFSQLEEILA